MLILLMGSFIAHAQVTSFVIDSSKFIRPLTKTLDSLYHEDQDGRMAYTKALNNKEPRTVTDSLRKIMQRKDSSNLVLVCGILDKHGWLSPQKVGMSASQALFLVIQHANLTTQLKYLPLIRTAEKNKEILSSNLAILEDRVNMRQGLRQMYGSQAVRDAASGTMYFYPIEKPEQLDVRRAAMGLIPMAEYAKAMNMEWDLSAYQKNLPAIEEKARKTGFKN